MHGTRLAPDRFRYSVDPIQIKRAEISGLVDAGRKRARSVARLLRSPCL